RLLAGGHREGTLKREPDPVLPVLAERDSGTKAPRSLHGLPPDQEMAAIGEEIRPQQRLQDVAFWKRAGFDPERGGSRLCRVRHEGIRAVSGGGTGGFERPREPS